MCILRCRQKHPTLHHSQSKISTPKSNTHKIYHNRGIRTHRTCIVLHGERIETRIVRDTLPGYGLAPEAVEHVCEMIMSTKTPQSPRDLMGMVLCDADLDYLGTMEYEDPANQLRDELNVMNHDLQQSKWLDLQISFLEQHQFFTSYAQVHREP